MSALSVAVSSFPENRLMEISDDSTGWFCTVDYSASHGKFIVIPFDAQGDVAEEQVQYYTQPHKAVIYAKQVVANGTLLQLIQGKHTGANAAAY